MDAPASATIDRPGGAAGTGVPKPPRTFQGIQAGRGLAAIAVVVSHSSMILAEPRFYGQSLLDGRLGKLGAGVDFFFVLSGFIITWAHWGDIGRPERLRGYAWRRFSRIYPTYWVVLVPLIVAYALAPQAGTPEQHDPWNMLASLLLLPYPTHPVLGVAWTLVYEMIFYVMFAGAIRFGRSALVPLLAWQGAVVVANLAVPRFVFPFTILLDSANLEFLAGVLTAVWLRRGRVPAPGMVAIVGILAFVALIAAPIRPEDAPLAMRIGYGAAAALAVAGLVEVERSRRLVVPGWLKLLGAASYAVYLIHGVAISSAVQVARRLAPAAPLPAVLAALVIAGALVGIAFHLAVERPLTAALGRRGRR